MPVILGQILIIIEFSRQIFKILSSCNEYPASGSLVPCGRMDGRTDMTKQIVVFHNFATAHKTDRLNYPSAEWIYFAVDARSCSDACGPATVLPCSSSIHQSHTIGEPHSETYDLIYYPKPAIKCRAGIAAIIQN